MNVHGGISRHSSRFFFLFSRDFYWSSTRDGWFIRSRINLEFPLESQSEVLPGVPTEMSPAVFSSISGNLVSLLQYHKISSDLLAKISQGHAALPVQSGQAEPIEKQD